MHLSSKPAVRREQLAEIQADIDHIIESTKTQNLIVGGDFNLVQDGIRLQQVVRVNNSECTWRRNNAEFTSLIDHYYVSPHISGVQTNIVTESDHKAILLKVEGLRRHRGLYLPKTNSALSKSKTEKADIKNTGIYPHIHIHNYCNGNRLIESMATEDRLQEIKKQRQDDMINGQLVDKREWNKVMQYTKQRPYKTQEALTRSDGRVITNHYEYIEETIKCIEKATQQQLHKTNPRRIEIPKHQVEDVVRAMANQWQNVDPGKSCGPDGVHPSLLKTLKPWKEADKGKITNILRSSLRKDDFFASRPVLIPKPNSEEKRPLQVLNVPLRLLEKSILRQVVNPDLLQYKDKHYGFMPGKSTHDAYRKLESVLRDQSIQKEQVLFVDFAKAYNSLSHRRLVEIVERKYEGWTKNCLKQIILKQTMCIFEGHYYKPSNGIMQGSSVAPFLCNLYIDQVMAELKETCPRMDFISYADDLVIWGDFDITQLEEVFKKHNLTMNRDKCRSFMKKLRNIRKVKTFKYLGTKIKEDGTAFGYTTLRKELGKKAKNIRRIGAHNAYKGYRIFNAVVGGKLAFLRERFDTKDDYFTLLKSAIKLPSSLPVDAVKLLIEKTHDTRDNKDEYFNTAVRLLRLNGVKRLDQSRYTVPTSALNNTPAGLEMLRLEVVRSLPKKTTQDRRGGEARQDS